MLRLTADCCAGVGGVCAHQPRIDQYGNSLQAMALVRGMVERLPTLSVFNATNAGL